MELSEAQNPNSHSLLLQCLESYSNESETE